MRKDRADTDVPFDAARKVPHADREQSFRVPIAEPQRYGDDLYGPPMPNTTRIAERNGDETCDVAGVPLAAEHFREADVTPCFRFRRDRIEFNPPLLACELAMLAGPTIDDDLSPATPDAMVPATTDLDEHDRLASRHETAPAGPSRRGLPATGGGQGAQDSSITSSARAALQYVRTLEKYSIWGPSTIDVNALLRLISLTMTDLAGAETGVMAYPAERLLPGLWQRAFGGEVPDAVCVVLEEAHTLVPGGRGGTRVSRIVNTVATEERNLDSLLVVISQHPSRNAEDTLSQCASQRLMRLTDPDGQKAVQRASEAVPQALVDALPGLGQGEVVGLGCLTRIPAMVQVSGRTGAESGADLDLWERFAQARPQVEDERSFARIPAARPTTRRSIRPPTLN